LKKIDWIGMIFWKIWMSQSDGIKVIDLRIKFLGKNESAFWRSRIEEVKKFNKDSYIGVSSILGRFGKTRKGIKLEFVEE